MKSALYHGWLSHRRLEPTGHAFRYRMFMVWLDLGELPRVFRGRWLWSVSRAALARLRREDYLGPFDRPLDAAVRDLVLARTGARPAGRVCMLTHLRYFGYCFNPVTFYYCYDRDDRLETVVAEVTNTPWRERFQYVLPVAEAGTEGGRHAWHFAKQFHVSPFLPMEMDYEWQCNAPAGALGVRILNRQHGRPVFEARLALKRRPINGLNLAAALAGFPFLTALLVLRIHWQALRLWLKRTPFHAHPGRAAGT